MGKEWLQSMVQTGGKLNQGYLPSFEQDFSRSDLKEEEDFGLSNVSGGVGLEITGWKRVRFGGKGRLWIK